jgi:hypothetical protein
MYGNRSMCLIGLLNVKMLIFVMKRIASTNKQIIDCQFFPRFLNFTTNPQKEIYNHLGSV